LKLEALEHEHSTVLYSGDAQAPVPGYQLLHMARVLIRLLRKFIANLFYPFTVNFSELN